MADFIAKLKVDSKEYDSKIERARSGLLALEKNLKETGKDFTQADAAQVQFVKDMGRMETVSRTAAGQMTELKKTFTDLSIQYKRMSDLERQSPIGKAMAQSLGQLKGRIATLRTDLAGVEKQLGSMSGLGMGGALKGAFSMFGPAALAAGGVIAALNGVRKAMGDLVSVNMQFEQASANLAAVMGKTRDQTSALTEQAKQLGATTQYTAVQITDLQTNLARLGFTESEILNSTKAVQALATATGADLGEAANLAGAALRGFGMNASEMERVASVLAVSTTKSALSFEKLATALPTVAPVAKQFGFSIEDTVTLLGKLSDAGLDASTAGTATRKILLNLADANGKLAQALGRPVSNVEELGDALVQLKEKGLDLNKMLELTDVRSVTAFATFVDNAQTLKDFKSSITDCSDAMQGMVDEQLNTLQGSVTLLKSAWDGLLLSFSNSNGILKSATDALAGLLQAWTDWRNRDAGGDAAISSYELGMTDKQRKGAQAIVAGYRAGGMKDSEIKQRAESEIDAINKEKESVRALYDELDKLNKKGTDVKAQEWSYWNKQFSQAFPSYDPARDGNNRQTYLEKTIAGLNDKIAYQEYIKSLVTPAAATTTTPTQTVPKPEQAKEVKGKWFGADMSKMFEVGSLADLEQQAAMVREAMKGATTVDEYKEMESHLNVILGQIKELRGEIDITFAPGSMNDLQQQLKEAQATLNGLAPDTEEWAEAFALVQSRQQAVNDLQDKMKVKVEETTSKFDAMRDAIGTAQEGIGAISELGNSFDDLKNIVEDLQDAFSGEMEAWDAMMTVFNSGIGVMQTVVNVMEAINTLSELAAALSDIKIAKQQQETATVVAGKAAETTADLTEASASAASTGVTTGEAVSKAADSVAGIPVVGPILAVAAAATVLGAILAAVMSARSSVGKFAEGGIVPGSSFTGDRLTANVNSGELILNRAQQNSIAAQLTAGSRNEGAKSSTPYVTGDMIVLGANNYLAQTGHGEIVTTKMLRQYGLIQ